MPDRPVIFGFGSACVDFRIHIPDMGAGYTAKVLADDTMELGGGACANCLVQAARLGGECTYLGKLGNDPQGQLILNLFHEENIKTKLIEPTGRILSPFNVAVYKGKNNERVGGYLLPNSLGTISTAEAAQLASFIPEGASVIVEIGEIPIESIIAFLRAVHSKGALIYMDVDLDPISQMGTSIETFEVAASLADILIPNYEAIRDIYGMNDRKSLCRLLYERTGSTVIITAGGEDIEYFDRKKGAGSVPVARIANPLDTVGAGDSFHGSLIYFMGVGNSLEAAIKKASICAGETCMGFGARASMPYHLK
ncbi:MAG: carbohydrate kinase family protein [Clostridia bacterium]|nr:carbohydrate kinase family protein [Clostridia bacterium]